MLRAPHSISVSWKRTNLVHVRNIEPARRNIYSFIRYSKTRDAGMKMSCDQMSFCSGKIAECNTMAHVDMESALEIRQPRVRVKDEFCFHSHLKMCMESEDRMKACVT